MRKFDDIIPPSRRRDTEPLARPSEDTERPLLNLNQPKKSRFPYSTLVVVVAIVAISVGALFYFSTAKVEITPTSISAAVQGSFVADKSLETLPFEIITAQKIATQSVKSSGVKTASSTATGTITIYNTQTKSQPLVIKTRFATASGLIFYTYSALTVPAGTVSKPGSIKAKVYAEKAGPAYNVAPTSFTVLGFAGTPKASQVYARSESAMTGGSSGNVPMIESSLETKTRNELIKALDGDLAKAIREKVQPGYVLLPGATTIKYDELASESYSNNMADVKEQGTITAVVFPNSAIAKAIANSVSGMAYQGEPVTLSQTEGLLFATASQLSPELESISFTVTGNATLVYTVDTTRIAVAVSGKTRGSAEVALTNYPEIKRAIITLRPFWRQAFPQDPASIKVVVDGL